MAVIRQQGRGELLESQRYAHLKGLKFSLKEVTHVQVHNMTRSPLLCNTEGLK